MKNKEIDKKNIERLLDGTKTILLATDNGIGINGGLTQLLGSFSLMVHQMKKGGMNEDLLRYAFKVGMSDSPEKEELNIDETTKQAKKELKELLKNLSEVLGDDDE